MKKIVCDQVADAATLVSFCYNDEIKKKHKYRVSEHRAPLNVCDRVGKEVLMSNNTI